MNRFQQTLFNLIRARDFDNIVSEEISALMAISLENFTVRAIDKFVAGQKEHGGDIRNRNLGIEFAQEVIDQFWYGPFGAMSWPKKSDNNQPQHD